MADQTVAELTFEPRCCPAVPEELLSRFLAEEEPQFKLLRQVGDVRLWESRTQPFERHGFTRPSHTRYHITESESLSLCLMPALDTAILNFVALSEQAHRGYVAVVGTVDTDYKPTRHK